MSKNIYFLLFKHSANMFVEKCIVFPEIEAIESRKGRISMQKNTYFLSYV